MKRKTPRRASPLPLVMAELTLSSWETIYRRTMMMAGGSCSDAEYHRMVWEKLEAAQSSALAMMFPSIGGGLSAALAPWHRGAMANARRLRRR